MTVLRLLDDLPAGGEATPTSAWFSQIERSLEQSPGDWIAAVEAIGGLSDDHSWSLLAWIETAASQVVRTRSRTTLATAAFAMSLALRSRLDRRDCSVVGSLLRRAADLAGLDFAASVAEGGGRAGSKGQEAMTLLLHAEARTPSTHVESGAGEMFAFARRAPGFDVESLERWLDGDEG